MAQVFNAGAQEAFLEVREDVCFKPDAWLRIGRIKIHPPGDEQGGGEPPVEQALRYGSYAWFVSKHADILAQIKTTYKDPAKTRDQKQQAKFDDKTRRALEAIMHCAVRCGFVHPSIDARCVTEMPFAWPTTVVVDTSAVMQGGLDFVVRFLYPMVRIKIPAIVHMEILNMADRYFTWRRNANVGDHPAAALLDHTTSQGSQRALLRLELQTNVEIERPRIGADPLRGVVQPDADAEDKALNLQIVQRSFADRLILETAIHHRDRLSPDHPIMVLTADQGLARMTLGEGLHPLFFSLPDIELICGRALSGTGFRPFMESMNESAMFHISLPSIVWELACTFGSARLVTADSIASFSVSAIGGELTWHPFHSHDDLLWTEQVGGTPTTPVVPPVTNGAKVIDRQKGEAGRKPHAGLTGSYRFPVKSMLTLIMTFEHKDRISDREGGKIVNLETARRYLDFRNFLLAGGFAEKDRNSLRKLPRMDDLIEALKLPSPDRIKQLFSNVPSVTAYLDELTVGKPITAEEITSVGKAAVSTYLALSEICCAAVNIPDEGIYATPNSPRPSEFASLALSTYRALRGGDVYVLIGKWLEELARKHGIHPIKARERLNEAREQGLLERYTEGSTPETQYERHKMVLLESNKGEPVIRRLNLYHGTFLIPEKASVSIRLEEKPNEPAR